MRATSTTAADPLRARVTVVTAAAGYGKTTAVRGWLRGRPARWLHAADVPPGDPIVAGGDSVVVVDDLHLGPAEPPAARLTGAARLVLVTRQPLSTMDLRRYGDPPAHIGPARLALSPERTAQLLRRRYDLAPADLAARLHSLTAGWPALVHLAGGVLAGDPALARRPARASAPDPLLDALAAPGTPLFDYVTAEIFNGLPPETDRLFRDVAELGLIGADLAAALGHERADAAITLLARLGLLDPPTPGHDWYGPVPVVAAVARRAPGAAVRRDAVVATAIEWHAGHGRPADALRLAVAAGDDALCAGLLREHGAELLAGGHAPAVVSGVRALPARFRDQHTDLVLADALQITGDTAGAISVYSGLAGDRAELPAALAWRYGAAVYMWGDPRDALGVLRRGPLAEPATTDPGTAEPATAEPAMAEPTVARRPTADEALLLAWTAAAYWLAGDTDACAAHAHRAQRAAVAAGDDRALAAAHVALGLHAHLAGDPAGVQGHYTAALELAESAGDVPQVVRTRANLAAGLEQQGRFAEALETIAPAVVLAEQAGYASMLAMALSNEGVFLHRLGRLDEAVARQQRSAEIYQRTHSHKVAYPLVALGDVHRRRGRLSEAKAAYDEAIRASESDGGNRQGLVPALAGLARVLAASDPAAARQAADRAVAVAAGHQRTTALLARGWSALGAARAFGGAVGAGERAAALRDAAAATDSAGRHRDRAGLAEALELRAVAGGGPQARAALAEARAIWRDAGAGLDADRVQLALAELPDADQQDRLRGRLAAARLVAAGIVVPAAAPDPAEPLPVQVKVLGGLAVLVGGRPVPATAWQSRKARDLLRALVARRGQPVAREELTDLLWGPVDPAERDKVNHRLSVALSTLRAVLDPERRAAADYFVIADSGTIAADVDHITLDVLQWLAEARYGLRLRDSGDPAGAWSVLTVVEREYTGEAFADDPYDGWSRQLSEEARATCLHVLRVLVELSQRSGDTDDAVRYLLRLLAIDPYDEQSHWDLVGTLSEAGRHGEARRAHQRYAEAMAEIGVPVRAIARRSA